MNAKTVLLILLLTLLLPVLISAQMHECHIFIHYYDTLVRSTPDGVGTNANVVGVVNPDDSTLDSPAHNYFSLYGHYMDRLEYTWALIPLPPTEDFAPETLVWVREDNWHYSDDEGNYVDDCSHLVPEINPILHISDFDGLERYIYCQQLACGFVSADLRQTPILAEACGTESEESFVTELANGVRVSVPLYPEGPCPEEEQPQAPTESILLPCEQRVLAEVTIPDEQVHVKVLMPNSCGPVAIMFSQGGEELFNLEGIFLLPQTDEWAINTDTITLADGSTMTVPVSHAIPGGLFPCTIQDLCLWRINADGNSFGDPIPLAINRSYCVEGYFNLSNVPPEPSALNIRVLNGNCLGGATVEVTYDDTTFVFSLGQTLTDNNAVNRMYGDWSFYADFGD
jgi:hypothetical protein